MSEHDLRSNSGDVDPPITPEAAAARSALLALPDPEPRSAFRERLRVQFTAAQVEPVRRGEPWFRRFGFWVLAPAAVVAMLLAVVVLNRGSRWTVQDAPDNARLVIDGAVVGAGESDRLRELLRGGAHVELRDSLLVTLAIPGQIFVQLLPGTDMTLPEPPGRWFGRAMRASLDSGELRITTDAGFVGARLFVDTPELEVEVLGTTLAVIRPDFGTCVCVLEGTVFVRQAASPGDPSSAPGASPTRPSSEPVPAGRRYTLFSEDGRVDRGEILAEERMKLDMLQSLCVPEHGHGP